MSSSDLPFAEPSLHLTCYLPARKRRVYEAWVGPGEMGLWAAPQGYRVTQAQGTPQPGGTWRSNMIAPTGEELWLSGEYRELIPGEKLVFTHAWEENGARGFQTLVEVRFLAEGQGTKLDFRQGPFANEASRNGHQAGWAECFQRLQAYLQAEG